MTLDSLGARYLPDRMATARGLVALVLELPTGGLADALGRKPVLTTAWTMNLVALLFLAWALLGVFRALDGGP